MTAKYIIYANDAFVVFSGSLKHKDVAIQLATIVNDTPVSAVFYSDIAGRPRACGGSFSMSLESRADDAVFLKRQLDHLYTPASKAEDSDNKLPEEKC